MRHRNFAAPLLLVFGLLAGCGQKGPLYLPTKAAVPASASSTPTPATAASTAKPAGPATVAAPASSSSDGG